MTFDQLFTQRPAGQGAWTAPSPPPTDETRLFGGLLLGHALIAACAETPRRCHALHAFFLSGGAKDAPLELGVTRIRDGRRYAARSVEMRQDGQLLLVAMTSHHDGDEGPEHQLAMPDVPLPEALEDQQLLRRRHAAARGAPLRRHLAEEMLDARPVEMSPALSAGVEGRRAVWVRPRERIAGASAVHQAALAFASDLGLVHVGLQAHNALGGGAALQATSLDHAIWFHRETAFDDWMLQVQRCPVAADGRGWTYGAIFNRDGLLVASAAQEILARRRTDARASD